eukprot:10292863-Alexandrium_andersonii.AAC.1
MRLRSKPRGGPERSSQKAWIPPSRWRPPQLQHPAPEAPREAPRPQGWALRIGVSTRWRTPGLREDRSAL